MDAFEAIRLLAGWDTYSDDYGAIMVFDIRGGSLPVRNGRVQRDPGDRDRRGGSGRGNHLAAPTPNFELSFRAMAAVQVAADGAQQGRAPTSIAICSKGEALL